MSDYPHRFSSHDQYCKAIIRLVGSISGSYNTAVVFTDCCRCMQLSIASQVNTREHDRLEAEYMTYVEKYGKKGMLAMADVFSLVVECLDTYREDVLGHVLEHFGNLPAWLLHPLVQIVRQTIPFSTEYILNLERMPDQLKCRAFRQVNFNRRIKSVFNDCCGIITLRQNGI